MKPWLFFLLLILLLVSACSRDGAAKKAAAVTTAAPVSLEVSVARAEARSIERSVDLTGTLLPDESVNVSAEVPGTLARVLVDFGQSVRAGQVVAEIDRRELTLQVERTRAALAQVAARIGLNPDEENATVTSTPAMRQAQAQLEDARSKFQSAEKLVKSGDVSQERYTELEKSYRAREAAVQATQDELRAQFAMVAQLRAELRLAQKRLGDATVRAPFDGAVTARMISAGQYVKENTPILTIVKTSPLRLHAEIPESIVEEVRLGTTLVFTTEAVPEHTFHAVVRQLNPSLDSRSRSLTAEARLIEADGHLRPGMFVQVRVKARTTEAIVVPKRAIYSLAGLTKVYAIRGGAAVECRVQTGQQLGDWVEVAGDSLKAGDAVATSNIGALYHGAKVITKG